MNIDLAALPDDVATLQRIVRTLAAERAILTEAQAEIERLRLIESLTLARRPKGCWSSSEFLHALLIAQRSFKASTRFWHCEGIACHNWPLAVKAASGAAEIIAAPPTPASLAMLAAMRRAGN